MLAMRQRACRSDVMSERVCLSCSSVRAALTRVGVGKLENARHLLVSSCREQGKLLAGSDDSRLMTSLQLVTTLGFHWIRLIGRRRRGAGGPFPRLLDEVKTLCLGFFGRTTP